MIFFCIFALEFDASDKSETLNHFFEDELSDLLSELAEDTIQNRGQFQNL